jgi:hypothetical protein
MRVALNLTRSVLVVLAVLVSACMTQPEKLPNPSTITCVFLSSPLSFTASYGPFHVPWTTTLANGPYVSVKLDQGGTYYRAPPGGLSVIGAPGSSYHGASPPGFPPGQMDGGFYIPNDPSKPPRIYRYFAVASVPVDPDYQAANCSTVGYERAVSGIKLSLIPFAAGGAAGGAVAGVTGRSIAKGSNMSYGQAAGVGAAGGLIGGLIVGEIINSGVGEMDFSPFDIRDAQFRDELQRLVALRVPLREVPQERDITPDHKTQ